ERLRRAVPQRASRTASEDQLRFGFGQTENMLELDVVVQFGALRVRQVRLALAVQQLRKTLQRFRRRTEIGNLLNRGSVSDEVHELHVDRLGSIHTRLLNRTAALRTCSVKILRHDSPGLAALSRPVLIRF